MSEIFGNVVDVDTSLAALSILEDCVQRMKLRLWDDSDERSVKKIDTLLRDEEQDEYIDSRIYTLARCIQIMTDIIDITKKGEKSHD